MNKKQTFSKRNGHFSIKEKEITIREDAPEGLRGFIRMVFYDLNKNPSDLRDITSRVLKIAPDSNNWSEFPNIDYEVSDHLDNCEWYLVYDIIEVIIQKLNGAEKETFISEINEYFVTNGIGWKIVNEEIETRGDEVFETAVNTVVKVLESAKLQTAKTEIREALNDLSRRPSPDITGAIQHSLACLECVSREITGDKKATLGELMKKYPGVIPSPLDQAVTKIWGFTSEQGRHLREGEAPEYLEAELVVEVTAAISTYLGKKLGGTSEEIEPDEFPF
ncbi:AbiJ-NTD4 domain-containing protein [Polaribacter sp. R77954]|uniref:AbiJ-NTD4 domain-containing protein n=1 Tax=Polaribacter sp. R77954 TaxID=3093870 RepID=UPI0037CBD84D